MPSRSIGFIAVLLLCAGCGSGPQQSATPVAEFDPQKIPELAIKGVKPDGADVAGWSGIAVPAKPEFTAELQQKGREFFVKACAGCHGDKGAGDGIVTRTYGLMHAPADLSNPLKSIKIRSTAYGTPPLPEDLFRTLTRGMPDTPMWSYRNLSAAERWALVAYVQTLSPKYARPVPQPVEIPEQLSESPELLELGTQVWQKTCLNCHGSDGLGAAAMSGQPFQGLKFARDGGRQMLSGSSAADIARTLLTGYHTLSPMMSFKTWLYGDEPSGKEVAEGNRKLWGTVYFVRELLKTQAARDKKN